MLVFSGTDERLRIPIRGFFIFSTALRSARPSPILLPNLSLELWLTELEAGY
jgi:hypothetical protein